MFGRGVRGRRVDILLTHAPPRGVGDEPDLAHRGFTSINALVGRLNPALLLHGHVQPGEVGIPTGVIGSTIVRNVTGRHLLEIDPVGFGCELSAAPGAR